MIEYAYAKINLTLNILNKREDGYHNLKSIMVPISLYDKLYFIKFDEYILESNYNLDTSKNIITKAYNIINERYNIGGIKIILEKNIPTEAGLGGGSSDATATIRGLNKFFNLNMSISEQEEIANLLGSDTLFTLHSKPAVITSRGDKLEFIDVEKPINVLLVKPNYGFSTKDLFSNIKSYEPNHNDNVIAFLKENNIDLLKQNINNTFLNVCISLNSNYKQLYEELSKYDIVHLSGSGSTLYIISEDIEHLRSIESKIKNCYTYICNTLI